MEEYKYKKGDKLLIEAVVGDVDAPDSKYPYHLGVIDDFYLRLEKRELESLGQSKVRLKPKVSQEVVDWYIQVKEKKSLSPIFDLNDLFSSELPKEVRDWVFYPKDNWKKRMERQIAVGTLFLYGQEAVEVENLDKDKQKFYMVKLKSSDQYLCETYGRMGFANVMASAVWKRNDSLLFTEKELIEHNFEDVFDNKAFELIEVYK